MISVKDMVVGKMYRVESSFELRGQRTHPNGFHYYKLQQDEVVLFLGWREKDSDLFKRNLKSQIEVNLVIGDKAVWAVVGHVPKDMTLPPDMMESQYIIPGLVEAKPSPSASS